MNSNWWTVNKTIAETGLYDFIAYDGGYLAMVGVTGGGLVSWQDAKYQTDTYKNIRPGGNYRYAVVVKAEYDGGFEFDDIPSKP